MLKFAIALLLLGVSTANFVLRVNIRASEEVNADFLAYPKENTVHQIFTVPKNMDKIIGHNLINDVPIIYKLVFERNNATHVEDGAFYRLAKDRISYSRINLNGTAISVFSKISCIKNHFGSRCDVVCTADKLRKENCIGNQTASCFRSPSEENCKDPVSIIMTLLGFFNFYTIVGTLCLLITIYTSIKKLQAMNRLLEARRARRFTYNRRGL